MITKPDQTHLNASQYRRKSDWTCNTYSAPPSQQSPPPTISPAPPTEQISNDSTFNVQQLNANGIGNKLTELGVVMERNKVKVAVIQESKLSPKSKNPCIWNYTTVHKDRPHRQGGGDKSFAKCKTSSPDVSLALVSLITSCSW